ESQRQNISQHLESHDVEHVFKTARVSQRALSQRTDVVVVEERQVFRKQFIHRFDVQFLQSAYLSAGEKKAGESPNRFTSKPDSGESQYVWNQLAQARPCLACEFAEPHGDGQRGLVKNEDLANARQ